MCLAGTPDGKKRKISELEKELTVANEAKRKLTLSLTTMQVCCFVGVEGDFATVSLFIICFHASRPCTRRASGERMRHYALFEVQIWMDCPRMSKI